MLVLLAIILLCDGTGASGKSPSSCSLADELEEFWSSSPGEAILLLGELLGLEALSESQSDSSVLYTHDIHI